MKFLNLDGLAYFWNKIKNLLDDITNKILEQGYIILEQEYNINRKPDILYIKKNEEDSYIFKKDNIYEVVPNQVTVYSSNDTFNINYNGQSIACASGEAIELDELVDCINMFSDAECDDIDASLMNTENVTNMSYMFYNIRMQKDLDVSNFRTLNVTNMMYMFRSVFCSDYIGKNLTLNLKNFDISKVEHIDYMFADNCFNTLIVDDFNMINIYRNSNIFYNTKFNHIKGRIYNIKTSLYIGNADLDRDSLLMLINGLWDFSSEQSAPSQVFFIGDTLKSRLTPLDIAIASEKGWTIG